MNAINVETSHRVITGAGTLSRIFDDLPPGASSAALITGNHFFKSQNFRLLNRLAQDKNIQLIPFIVGSEPRAEVIDAIVRDLTKVPDLVIGVGGGSALDAAKAVAVMLTSEGETGRYLEGVGDLEAQPRQIPFFAVPTTSGTGSEATKNAVFIKSGEISYKKSIRHDSYIPDLVILDPQLTLNCPPSVTAACGFDAIAQLLEAYISTKATEYTDRVCLEGLTNALSVFPAVCSEKAGCTDSREKMAIAAYLSGVGLANAGLVNIHGIAGPVGGETDIPHGVAVAMIFPETLKMIVDKLPQDSIALEKLNRIGELITDPALAHLTGCRRVIRFLSDTRAGHLGITDEHYPLTEQNILQIAKESSDKNSPVSLSKEEIAGVLRLCFSVNG